MNSQFTTTTHTSSTSQNTTTFDNVNPNARRFSNRVDLQLRGLKLLKAKVNNHKGLLIQGTVDQHGNVAEIGVAALRRNQFAVGNVHDLLELLRAQPPDCGPKTFDAMCVLLTLLKKYNYFTSLASHPVNILAILLGRVTIWESVVKNLETEHPLLLKSGGSTENQKNFTIYSTAQKTEQIGSLRMMKTIGESSLFTWHVKAIGSNQLAILDAIENQAKFSNNTISQRMDVIEKFELETLFDAIRSFDSPIATNCARTTTSREKTSVSRSQQIYDLMSMPKKETAALKKRLEREIDSIGLDQVSEIMGFLKDREVIQHILKGSFVSDVSNSKKQKDEWLVYQRDLSVYGTTTMDVDSDRFDATPVIEISDFEDKRTNDNQAEGNSFF